MDPRDKEKLQRNYAVLLDVIYSSISPHLISAFVLTLEMHDEIECRRTERKKMEKLLSILPSRGNNAMRELINALKPSYRWIARELERDVNDTHTRAFPANFRNNNNNAHNLPDIGIGNHVREITRILRGNPRASTHWTVLANSMSLEHTTINDIKREMSYSGGHEYAIQAVLEGWVSEKGNSQATFSKLLAIFRREGWNQCREEVLEYWESLTLNGYPDGNYNNEREREPHRLLQGTRTPVITDV